MTLHFPLLHFIRLLSVHFYRLLQPEARSREWMGGIPRLVRTIKGQWCSEGPHSAACTLRKDASKNLRSSQVTQLLTQRMKIYCIMALAIIY